MPGPADIGIADANLFKDAFLKAQKENEVLFEKGSEEPEAAA